MLRVLLIDDEPTIRLTVGDAIGDLGHDLIVAVDGTEALAILERRDFDVVISDIRMPGADGLSIFRQLRAEKPETDVILITGYGEVRQAVEALKAGAHDYITKPFDTDEVLVKLSRIDARRSLEMDLRDARRELGEVGEVSGIVGRSPQINRLRERIETLAASDAAVLIQGASGTGKELVARNLHDLSGRRTGPFVAVHCAAFPETLIEAELFGHERGAFTGAVRRREGRFQAADGGTLLLDEVGEIALPVQAKLLRVLQEGVIEPLGSNDQVRINVRIVSATHRNLKQLISEGLFREDLYYRLNVLDIPVPPLRDRHGDLPLLTDHFLSRYGAGDPQPLTPRAWAALTEHTWPGNVRELQHAVEHAVVLSRGEEIDLQHLPSDLAALGGAPQATRDGDGFRPLAEAAGEFEREYLLRALRLSEGRKARAAELLGISRKNLWEKLKGHDVGDDEFRP